MKKMIREIVKEITGKYCWTRRISRLKGFTQDTGHSIITTKKSLSMDTVMKPQKSGLKVIGRNKVIHKRLENLIELNWTSTP